MCEQSVKIIVYACNLLSNDNHVHIIVFKNGLMMQTLSLQNKVITFW